MRSTGEIVWGVSEKEEGHPGKQKKEPFSGWKKNVTPTGKKKGRIELFEEGFGNGA